MIRINSCRSCEPGGNCHASLARLKHHVLRKDRFVAPDRTLDNQSGTCTCHVKNVLIDDGQLEVRPFE